MVGVGTATGGAVAEDGAAGVAGGAAVAGAAVAGAAVVGAAVVGAAVAGGAVDSAGNCAAGVCAKPKPETVNIAEHVAPTNPHTFMNGEDSATHGRKQHSPGAKP